MSELTQRRGSLAVSLELGLHAAILLTLLFLMLGWFYPVYLLASPWLGAIWTHRPWVMAGLLPFGWGALVFYLLGRCWSWRAQPEIWPPPYHRRLQLGVSLWGALLTGTVSLLLMGVLRSPFWGGSLGVALGPFLGLWLLPTKLRLQRLSLRPLWIWGGLLGVLQGLALWFWLGAHMEKSWGGMVLWLLSLVCVGPLSRGWSGQWSMEQPWSWRGVGALALGGLLVSGAGEAYQRQRLQQLRQELARATTAQQAALRWQRPVLRGQPRLGNAAPAYEALLLAKHVHLQTEDVQTLLGWFQGDTGRVEPDLKLLQRYASVLDRLRAATRWSEVHWFYQGHAVLRPRIGGLEEYGLLLAGETVAACHRGNCAEGLSTSWDALRLFQDFSAQGWLMPLMVAYRMERLVLSSTGAILRPGDLTPAAWHQTLQEWDSLLVSEQAHFDGVLQHDLLQGAETLTGFLPTLLTEDEDELPSAWPARWLDRLVIFPYVLHGLNALESLQKASALYLARDSHDPALWQALRDEQYSLLRQNPLLNSVSTDLNLSLQRYREHQTLLRGFAQYLALLAYAAEEGHYPANLQELIPHYLPRLPVDPFSGAVFRYRQDATGPVLYSVGLNGRDDGGQGFYGRYLRQPGCSGEEMVFALQAPAVCR